MSYSFENTRVWRPEGPPSGGPSGKRFVSHSVRLGHIAVSSEQGNSRYSIWRHRILCALILGLPFEYFFYGRDRTLYSSLKVQLVLFLAAWAGTRLVEARRLGWSALGRPLHRFPPRLLIAASCLAGTQILAAALCAEYRANAARAAAKLCLGVLIMVAAADVLRPSRRKQVGGKDDGRGLLLCLGIAGTSCALVGLAAAAGVRLFDQVVGAFQPQRFFLGGHLRLTSTMEYPNTAGSFLDSSLFAALALAIYRPFRKARLFDYGWLCAALVTAVALFMTYSRGAIGAALVALAVCAVALAPHLAARQRAIMLAAVGMALVALASVVARPFAGSGTSPAPRRVRSALYGLKAAEELKFLVPDRTYYETIGVRNNSSGTWTEGDFALATRWYDISKARSSALSQAAAIPRPVAPGEQIALTVTFHTPYREGDYLLIWFVVGRGAAVEVLENSYSAAVVCSVRVANGRHPQALSQEALGLMKTIREERRQLAIDFIPARSELWLAALRMFRANPLLGVGPDNFRMLKWDYMQMPGGDETILANNLFLEFLSGSGILGLAALCWLLWEILRQVRSWYTLRRSGPEAAVLFYSMAFFTGFLVHGQVDYFLKFTPTFLLFWITAGTVGSRAAAGEAGDAPGV